MSTYDLERFRLRRHVERLTELGEVEVHDEPVALADLSSVIESSDKAVLVRKAGPEQVELVAGVMGSRRRLAIALGVEEADSVREYERRLATPQKHFEVPSSDAPTGPDLGRGWLLLVVLTGTGLVSGLVMGWLARWRVAIGKGN